MSIRLPQWISEAPAGPEARSFGGSTVRPAEKPAAAEYIKLASSSNPKAAIANEIATRLESRLMLLGAFPGGGEPVRLEFRFRDVGGGPTFRGARRVIGLLVGGEQQHHDGAVRVLEDLPGRLETVDTGQVDVHQHEVGVQRLAGLERGFAGLGFGNHLEAVGSLDHRPRRLAERRLIVNDQHSHGHLSRYR